MCQHDQLACLLPAYSEPLYAVKMYRVVYAYQVHVDNQENEDAQVPCNVWRKAVQSARCDAATVISHSRILNQVCVLQPLQVYRTLLIIRCYVIAMLVQVSTGVMITCLLPAVHSAAARVGLDATA